MLIVELCALLEERERVGGTTVLKSEGEAGDDWQRSFAAAVCLLEQRPGPALLINCWRTVSMHWSLQSTGVCALSAKKKKKKKNVIITHRYAWCLQPRLTVIAADACLWKRAVLQSCLALVCIEFCRLWLLHCVWCVKPVTQLYNVRGFRASIWVVLWPAVPIVFHNLAGLLLVLSLASA